MLTVRRPFRLDKSNGKIMGVCAGIAAWFNIEAIWIRLGFVAAALFGFGAPILIYVVIGLVADNKSAQ
jgi:phage shock protein PspC (stress-responsive transcriptional regulator)